MDIKKVNEVLKNLTYPDSKVLRFVQKVDIDMAVTNSGGESQGESDEYANIYEVLGEDLFLKIVYNTDSYGSNASVVAIQFVKPVEKVVKVYENI